MSSSDAPWNSLTPEEQAARNCLASCSKGDGECMGKCITVPNPRHYIVTNKCTAGCPKGDGSPSATQAYAECVDKCIANN